MLDRQGTRQQRPESPAVTQLGMRVNTWYINSTKGRSPKTDAPSGIYTFHFRHTRRQRCVQVYERTKFLFLEKIMQETLHDHKTSISIGSRPICNLQFADDIDLIGDLTHVTTASPKTSFRVGDAVVGKESAGWIPPKSGHLYSCQNCSQCPPAEKTGRGSLINRLSSPPDNPINQGTELN